MTDPIYLNAMDSLMVGIDHYLLIEDEDNAEKHAILNVFHCLELLLKERLRRIDPMLIYRDTKTPPTAESWTVGADEAIKRLRKHGVEVTEDEHRGIKGLRRYRNRIEHHVYLPESEHQPLLAKALKFIYDFMPQHLGDLLENVIGDGEAFRRIRETIVSHEERLTEARNEIGWDEMKNKMHAALAECPECGNDTILVHSNRGDFCFYCHEEREVVQCERCGSFSVPDMMVSDLRFEEVCEMCSYSRNY